MFSSEITLTYKHGIILFLIIFMYWYAMDSVKSKTFKTDLEKVINKNISDQNYEYFTEKTHTIIGILCTGIGVVMNGLPVWLLFLFLNFLIEIFLDAYHSS